MIQRQTNAMIIEASNESEPTVRYLIILRNRKPRSSVKQYLRRLKGNNIAWPFQEQNKGRKEWKKVCMKSFHTTFVITSFLLSWLTFHLTTIPCIDFTAEVTRRCKSQFPNIPLSIALPTLAAEEEIPQVPNSSIPSAGGSATPAAAAAANAEAEFCFPMVSKESGKFSDLFLGNTYEKGWKTGLPNGIDVFTTTTSGTSFLDLDRYAVWIDIKDLQYVTTIATLSKDASEFNRSDHLSPGIDGFFTIATCEFGTILGKFHKGGGKNGEAIKVFKNWRDQQFLPQFYPASTSAYVLPGPGIGMTEGYHQIPTEALGKILMETTNITEVLIVRYGQKLRLDTTTMKILYHLGQFAKKELPFSVDLAGHFGKSDQFLLVRPPTFEEVLDEWTGYRDRNCTTRYNREAWENNVGISSTMHDEDWRRYIKKNHDAMYSIRVPEVAREHHGMIYDLKTYSYFGEKDNGGIRCKYLAPRSSFCARRIVNPVETPFMIVSMYNKLVHVMKAFGHWDTWSKPVTELGSAANFLVRLNGIEKIVEKEHEEAIREGGVLSSTTSGSSHFEHYITSTRMEVRVNLAATFWEDFSSNWKKGPFTCEKESEESLIAIHNGIEALQDWFTTFRQEFLQTSHTNLRFTPLSFDDWQSSVRCGMEILRSHELEKRRKSQAGLPFEVQGQFAVIKRLFGYYNEDNERFIKKSLMDMEGKSEKDKIRNLFKIRLEAVQQKNLKLTADRKKALISFWNDQPHAIPMWYKEIAQHLVFYPHPSPASLSLIIRENGQITGSPTGDPRDGKDMRLFIFAIIEHHPTNWSSKFKTNYGMRNEQQQQARCLHVSPKWNFIQEWLSFKLLHVHGREGGIPPDRWLLHLAKLEQLRSDGVQIDRLGFVPDLRALY